MTDPLFISLTGIAVLIAAAGFIGWWLARKDAAKFTPPLDLSPEEMLVRDAVDYAARWQENHPPERRSPEDAARDGGV